MLPSRARRRWFGGAIVALVSGLVVVVACDSFDASGVESADASAPSGQEAAAPLTDAQAADGDVPDASTKKRYCQTVDGGASDGGIFVCEDFDGVATADAAWDPWTPFGTGGSAPTRGPALTSDPFALSAHIDVTDAGPAAAGLRLPIPFAYGTLTIAFDLHVAALDSDAGVPPVVSLLRVYENQSGAKFLTELKMRNASGELRFDLLTPGTSYDATPLVTPVVGTTKRIELKFVMSATETTFTLTAGTSTSMPRTFVPFPIGVTEAAIDLGARSADPRAVADIRYDSVVIQR